MSFLRQHVLFKGLMLLLTVSLLLPSAIKFLHIFEHHHHEVCEGEVDAHFHTLDVDCEFYKFQIISPFTFPENASAIVSFPEIKSIISSDYSFLSEFQRLHFARRGPPSVNLI